MDGGKGMKFNFNKRKKPLGIVDTRVTDCRCRVQIALGIDEQRKIANITVMQWWKYEQTNLRAANEVRD